jgi:two-component system, chemotaxis family, protein-glutamate methylesterase/glutaminase
VRYPAFELVVIGVSAGGLQAMCTLLKEVPADFPMAIAIVQHRAKESDLLCGLLQQCTKLRVHEVVDKQPIEMGNVYIAPPDYHLLVEKGYFVLSTEATVRFSRPSIDVLFDSAADAYGAGVVGVVLTGANSDGARGLKRIVSRGGYAIVQNPASAEVAVMPRAALDAVKTAHVMETDEIAAHLIALHAGGMKRQVQ